MEKKGCGLILGDQARGRTLLVDVVGVENSENAKRLLNYAKEKYHLNPIIVTSDFSPNLIKPIKDVFGEHVLQIDGFHVMQELNIGIRRDLLDYRDRLYRAVIRDLLALHHWITKIQKEISTVETCSKTILKEKPNQNSQTTKKQLYWNLTTRVVKLMRLSDSKIFQNRLNQLLIKCQQKNDSNLENYAISISNNLPKHNLTEKGMIRLKITLLMRLKSFYRIHRTGLEEESLQFHRDHWVIFFQPEKLTPAREKCLTEFLTKYPELNEYRQMTLQIGEIYRSNIEHLDGHHIDDLVIKTYFSSKLQTAIRTIKKFKNSILRFVEVFKKDKSLGKACRANMEHANRPFKAPFRAGLNRTSEKTLLNKLRLQLGCEVRSFLHDTPKTCLYKKLQN